MKIKIKGDYLTDDLAVLGQHIAIQLEALGIASIGYASLYFTPRDAKGRKLDVLADGQPVDEITLEVSDLARPAVQSSKITARPASDRPASPSPSNARAASGRRYGKAAS